MHMGQAHPSTQVEPRNITERRMRENAVALIHLSPPGFATLFFFFLVLVEILGFP